MAQGQFFKTLNSEDRTTSRTLLHESIPITGAIMSGTYNGGTPSATWDFDQSQKTFSHGMFVSFYDYPYLSSSANHILDISCGIAPYVPVSGSGFQHGYATKGAFTASIKLQKDKKVNMYTQMSQLLSGYDLTGSARLFDEDGDHGNGDKIIAPIFVSFSRLLVKDEIKKGSFRMQLGVAHTASLAFGAGESMVMELTDSGSANNYKINSPVGEYGLLYATNKAGTPIAASGSSPVGLIYYQAGVAVLNAPRLFLAHTASHVGGAGGGRAHHMSGAFWSGSTGMLTRNCQWVPSGRATQNFSATTGSNIIETMQSGSINDVVVGFRRRLRSITFNNTTELNSTIYFCRAHHNEFNYSSNPTYLSSSKIVVKGDQLLTPPRSYITTVGLYSGDNELMAVAKLSEPLRKDPTNEVTLRVRLDY